MIPSYPKSSLTQRFGVALASVLITLCIVLGNLQLAEHEGPVASGMHVALAQGIVLA